MANDPYKTGQLATRSPSHPPPTDRRTLLRALAAGLLAIHPSTSTLAQHGTPGPTSLFTGATFVGETSYPRTFVAVVVGEETALDPRWARAYLCNGRERTIDVWLSGEASDGSLTLTAEDGSRLTGTFND